MKWNGEQDEKEMRGGAEKRNTRKKKGRGKSKKEEIRRKSVKWNGEEQDEEEKRGGAEKRDMRKKEWQDLRGMSAMNENEVADMIKRMAEMVQV